MPNNSRRISVTYEKHSATDFYGWFHRIDSGNRIPILNPDAVSAIRGIILGDQVPEDMLEHLKDAIDWHPGDLVNINGIDGAILCRAGQTGDLWDLLDRHT